MNIMFRLTAKIEIPDADKFPPREEVEKGLVEIFKQEGMIPCGLEVTNYCVSAEEEGK